MAADITYDYAVIRVVPRVERGERINIGVILSCVDSEYLACRFAIDEQRLRVLDPAVDIDAIAAAVASMKAVCAGGPSAGPLATLSARERFRWLVSPRSTVVQPSRIHTGRTQDPAATLDHLFATMVLPQPAPGR